MQLWSKRLPPWSSALEIKQIWLHCKVFGEKVFEISRCYKSCMVPHGTHLWGWHINHGAFDLDWISCMPFQAPCISKHLKEWVEERLDRNLITKQIYEEHKKVWFNAHVLISRNWPKGSKQHQRSHKRYFTLVLHVFFPKRTFSYKWNFEWFFLQLVMKNDYNCCKKSKKKSFE